MTKGNGMSFDLRSKLVYGDSALDDRDIAVGQWLDDFLFGDHSSES